VKLSETNGNRSTVIYFDLKAEIEATIKTPSDIQLQDVIFLPLPSKAETMPVVFIRRGH
jgi:hypothetical protein